MDHGNESESEQSGLLDVYHMTVIVVVCFFLGFFISVSCTPSDETVVLKRYDL